MHSLIQRCESCNLLYKYYHLKESNNKKATTKPCLVLRFSLKIDLSKHPLSQPKKHHESPNLAHCAEQQPI